MAAPRELNIIPDVGLKIEVVTKFEGINNTDSFKPWTYKITNLAGFFGTERAAAMRKNSISGFDEGTFSPTHCLTLHRMARINAGIPKDASSYAYMHPPRELVRVFHAVESNVAPNIDYDDADMSKGEKMRSLLALGAFAYFDEKFECLRINALSKKKTEHVIKLSGPFNVKQRVYEDLHKLGRTQEVSNSVYREVGFESFAWVCPKERIRFKRVLEGYDNNNGAFVFFREDRTAVGYAIDPSGYTNPKGEIGVISEAMAHTDVLDTTNDKGEIDNIDDIGRIGDIGLISEEVAHTAETETTNDMKPLFDIKSWVKKTKYFDLEADGIVKFCDNPDEVNTLLHKACHAALGADFVSKLLSNNLLGLSCQDEFGWNPLHYACRFSPRDLALIDVLVNACPDAVLQQDNFGRCPLHIACDSDTSKEVIAILLKADKSCVKNTILMETKKFKFLPIHFACFRGASESIIKALIDGDHGSSTINAKSNRGLTPLHIAILKQLPASTVKILLAGEAAYQSFGSRLPLHWACWNDSSSEVIEMLLEKMEKKRITRHLSLNDCDAISSSMKSLNSNVSSSLDAKTSALHFAMPHGSLDVISLLLEKETSESSFDVTSSTIYMKDGKGRTPLHIACKFNVDIQIIQLLIKLDIQKETIQMEDKQGYRPLHYACESEYTNIEVINILCDSEEYYIKHKHNSKRKKKSTHKGDKARNRTPLYLAVKTGSPTAVIEKLLEPQNFIMEGLDDYVTKKLADIVKDCEGAQEKIVDILSGRVIFGLIFIEGYANVIAIVALALGSEQLRNGTVTRVYPSLLVLSSCVFMSRELLQITSVGVEYIGDVWSWYEVVCIGFLLTTARDMFNQIDDPELEPRIVVLSVTGFLIVVQAIFYLRSTFLPFARFVGGLLMISRELLPFLIVSAMLVAAFVYIFWMSHKDQCDSLLSCMQSMMATIFDYSPEDADLLDFLFCLLIVIVLLNVVIAIVSEAWQKAAKKSTKLFWTYRLQKVGENEIFKETFLSDSSMFSLLRYIDDFDKISYSTCVIWSNPPYNNVTSKLHYDKPEDYFDSNVARKIRSAKSLQSDLYWIRINKVEGSDARSKSETVHIIFRWLCKCVFYILLIIMGMITGGILFPKNFRSALLSIGIRNDENDELSESIQTRVDPNISTSSNQSIISRRTLDNGTIYLSPPPTPPMPPAISLPQGWQAAVDPNSSRIYYVNSSTGHTSWEPPEMSKKGTGKQRVLGQNNLVTPMRKQKRSFDEDSNTNGNCRAYGMNLFHCF